MNDNLNLLIEKMKEQRFLPITEETFQLYNKYDSLIDADNSEQISQLLFYRGECYYRIGNFSEALEQLTRCIQAPKGSELKYLDALSYNLIGLIYGYLGQETVALNDLLECSHISQKYHFERELAVSYINLGVLYSEILNYEKALEYQKKAYLSLEKYNKNCEDLKLLCLSYQGILYSKMDQFEESEKLYSTIQKLSSDDQDFFYSASLLNLKMRLAYHSGDKAVFDECFHQFLQFASSDEDFLDYSEFYFDVCNFFLAENLQSESRTLLDYMETYAKDLPLVFLRYHILKFEVTYADKFCSKEDSDEASKRFLALLPAYREEQRTAKIYGLDFIERLHKAKNDSAQFEEQSKLDSMTGLLNKYTIEFLSDEYLNQKPKHQLSASILIDMDHFKQINDTLGHLAGDSIIVETATIIKHFFHEDCFCGRIGGDEFFVLVKSVNDSSSLLLQCELLRQEIYNQTSERNITVTTQASIGVAFSSEIHNDYEQLFNAADNALYHAKNEGRNKVVAAKDY